MVMKKIIKPADCFDLFLKSLSVFHQADDEALSEIKKRLYKRSCIECGEMQRRAENTNTVQIPRATFFIGPPLISIQLLLWNYNRRLRRIP
jgi:hypothetical protein